MAASGTAGAPQFASLYVGDLHQDATEAMLYEIFNTVGPVASIRVCRDSVSRRSLGYAYVNFHQVSDAERALDTLNYSSIKGRSCRIMWSHRDPSLRKSSVGNVFVKNLDKNIDNKALYDTFSLFGNILSCKVASDPDGKSRGYGFVHYETEEAAKQAIERVNGMQIGETTVLVDVFKKRDARPSVVTVFTNLYVKNLPGEAKLGSQSAEDWLASTFGACGEITSSTVMSDSKGRKFAFVDFKETDQAKAAIEKLHNTDMRADDAKDGEAGEDDLLYVQRAQSKAERAAEFAKTSDGTSKGVNLYIKNLGEEMDEEQLQELFASFGEITSVNCKKDDEGKCKGFGFVCFASSDAATKAVTEMHLKVVKGKPLYVGLAEKREARMERLRQRYSPSAKGGFGKGGGGFGKDGGKGKGGFGFGGKGGWGGPNMGMQQNMGGMGMMGGMYGGMGGKGGMPQPGMMGGMPPQGMMNPMMMGGKGGMNPMMMGGMPPQGMMNPMMMGKGGMPPQQQQQQMAQQQAAMQQQMMARQQAMQQQQMARQQNAAPDPNAPLTAAALAAAPPAMQKQMLGSKLYPSIAKFQPELAGKITGMMLEMDNSELLMLLESEGQLKMKVDEALRVLETVK